MSSISRLDQYLEKHDQLQRRTLRAKMVAGPAHLHPPPPPPPLVASAAPLTVKEIDELDATLLREHRYRLYRLKQVHANLSTSLALLDSEDLCLAQACVGEWDDETTIGHDETLEKSMLNGTALDNSMSLSRTLPMTRERQERQAKVASLISAFQQQPSAHLEDSTRDMRSQSAHSISRLEISSTYINSLLGLSAKEP
jgi:hypothetical protein